MDAMMPFITASGVRLPASCGWLSDPAQHKHLEMRISGWLVELFSERRERKKGQCHRALWGVGKTWVLMLVSVRAGQVGDLELLGDREDLRCWKSACSPHQPFIQCKSLFHQHSMPIVSVILTHVITFSPEVMTVWERTVSHSRSAESPVLRGVQAGRWWGSL